MPEAQQLLGCKLASVLQPASPVLQPVPQQHTLCAGMLGRALPVSQQRQVQEEQAALAVACSL